MIHTSPLPDVEVPEVALTGYVLERAAELGDKPALIDGPTGRTITYAGLHAAVHSFAGGLQARGFGRGDVLALMAPNLPEYAVVFHGTAVAGGTVTTINPTYTEREVHLQLLDSGARLLVTIPMFLEVAGGGSAGHRRRGGLRARRGRGRDAAGGPVRRRRWPSRSPSTSTT